MAEGKLDLFGDQLNGANFSGADLSDAVMRQAKLIGASFFGTDLSRADLSGADLSGAFLFGAKLCGAFLRIANLTDANVGSIIYLEVAHRQRPGIWPRFSAWASWLRQWLLANPTPYHKRLWKWMRQNPIPYRKRVMRLRYQGIRGLDSCYGNRIFVRDAADQDYLDTVESQLRGWWGKFWFWAWGLTDYGRSLMSVVVFASFLIFGFGWAYSHWPQMVSTGGRCPTWFTPYYFSIVTYTTLGFGDVKPNKLAGEILVSIEVIFGYVTLGLLLAVLGDRIARRS